MSDVVDMSVISDIVAMSVNGDATSLIPNSDVLCDSVRIVPTQRDLPDESVSTEHEIHDMSPTHVDDSDPRPFSEDILDISSIAEINELEYR